MRFNCTTEYLRRKHLLENLEPIKRQRICHLRVMHWQTKLKNFLLLYGPFATFLTTKEQKILGQFYRPSYQPLSSNFFHSLSLISLSVSLTHTLLLTLSFTLSLSLTHTLFVTLSFSFLFLSLSLTHSLSLSFSFLFLSLSLTVSL